MKENISPLANNEVEVILLRETCLDKAIMKMTKYDTDFIIRDRRNFEDDSYCYGNRHFTRSLK